MNDRPLILASTSPYRRELLARLQIDFTPAAPDADETPCPGEPPETLVMRLAEAKARSVAPHYPQALIIGSDQVASVEGKILGKPGDTIRAEAQLRRLSGRTVVFHTGIVLLDSATGALWRDRVPFYVTFRELSESTIRAYLQREPALDCAGAFKSEGLGVALCQRMEGQDPTALMGLPLIRLSQMLEAAGHPVI